MGWAAAQLCQMVTAMASSRWAMRVQTPAVVRPPWRSRSSWALRVSLTDSIHCRIQPMEPWRGTFAVDAHGPGPSALGGARATLAAHDGG